MKLTKSGIELRIVIEKAIKDHVITNSEYEEIMRVANKDGMLMIMSSDCSASSRDCWKTVR